MNIEATERFHKRLQKKIGKNPELKQRVGKQLQRLEKDFNHPSLKTHKLKGDRYQEYSIWIKGDLRITFLLSDSTIILTDIITHDEY